MTVHHMLLTIPLALLPLLPSWAGESSARPAILLLGQEPAVADWALPQKLAKDHGLVVGACGFGELTWDKLRQFNVVVLYDMSRLYEGTRDVNAVEISPEGFRRVSDLLYRFIQEGGGLYVYGVEPPTRARPPRLLDERQQLPLPRRA